MDDIFIRLKKTLFNLYLHYKDSDFFFVGAVVGRVTFRRFFQLVDDYGLNRNDANAFLALQLKHDDYKKLPYSDDAFSHIDAAHAIDFLKRHTTGPQFLAFIVTLHKKNDELKKFFAPLPDKVPILTFYFASRLLKCGLKKSFFIRDYLAKDYFRNFYHMSDDYFDNVVCSYAQPYNIKSRVGLWFNLCELAEFEQLFIEEKFSSTTDEQKLQFVNSLLDERGVDECLTLIKNLKNFVPTLQNFSVDL